MFLKKNKSENENEKEEESARENGFTITIARNSDGEILHLIQGTSIFAGVALTEEKGCSCSIGLNVGSTGLEALSAAEAAEKAIEKYEEKEKGFKLCRAFMKARNAKVLEEAGGEDDE